MIKIRNMKLLPNPVYVIKPSTNERQILLLSVLHFGVYWNRRLK